MSASFKNGVKCSNCQSEHVLELDGRLICMQCAAQFAQDTDQHIPTEVGTLIADFIRNGLFRYSWAQGHEIKRPVPAANFLNLGSAVNLNGRGSCKVQWFNSEIRDVTAPPKEPVYRPGLAGVIPQDIENLLRIALEHGLFVTEINNPGKFALRQARLTGVFGLADGVKALSREQDLDETRVLVVRLEVMWLDPENEQGLRLSSEHRDLPWVNPAAKQNEGA